MNGEIGKSVFCRGVRWGTVPFPDETCPVFGDTDSYVACKGNPFFEFTYKSRPSHTHGVLFHMHENTRKTYGFPTFFLFPWVSMEIKFFSSQISNDVDTKFQF